MWSLFVRVCDYSIDQLHYRRILKGPLLPFFIIIMTIPWVGGMMMIMQEQYFPNTSLLSLYPSAFFALAKMCNFLSSFLLYHHPCHGGWGIKGKGGRHKICKIFPLLLSLFLLWCVRTFTYIPRAIHT